MNQGKRYSQEFRTRAVELLEETRTNTKSDNKAIIRVASSLGISHETLRRWSRAADAQAFPSLSARQAQEELKRLRRENRELKRANEILQTASAFRFQARPNQELEYEFIDVYASRFGVEPICSVLKTAFKDGFTTARAYYSSKQCSVSLMAVRHEALARDIQEIRDDKFVRVYGYRTVFAQLINQGWLHIGLRLSRCSYVLVRNTRNTSRCKHLVTTRFERNWW